MLTGAANMQALLTTEITCMTCLHCSTDHDFNHRCPSGPFKGMTGDEITEARIAPQRAHLARRDRFREALAAMGATSGIAYLKALNYQHADDMADLPLPPAGWKPGDPVPTVTSGGFAGDELPEPDPRFQVVAKAAAGKADRKEYMRDLMRKRRAAAKDQH